MRKRDWLLFAAMYFVAYAAMFVIGAALGSWLLPAILPGLR